MEAELVAVRVILVLSHPYGYGIARDVSSPELWKKALKEFLPKHEHAWVDEMDMEDEEWEEEVRERLHAADYGTFRNLTDAMNVFIDLDEVKEIIGLDSVTE